MTPISGLSMIRLINKWHVIQSFNRNSSDTQFECILISELVLLVISGIQIEIEMNRL